MIPLLDFVLRVEEVENHRLNGLLLLGLPQLLQLAVKLWGWLRVRLRDRSVRLTELSRDDD